MRERQNITDFGVTCVERKTSGRWSRKQARASRCNYRREHLAHDRWIQLAVQNATCTEVNLTWRDDSDEFEFIFAVVTQFSQHNTSYFRLAAN
jgi:hypothetical protein